MDEEGKNVVLDGEVDFADFPLRITPGTIARTIILGLAILNKILTRFGHPIIDIDSAVLTEFIGDAWLIISGIAAWWKNNSFTMPAMAGDVVMRMLRKGKKEEEEDGAD